MRPQDIITKKRDGKRLSEEEISFFIKGVTDGSWADYQTTALIMAMFLNELDSEEQSYITQAMLNSGDVLDFSDIDKPKADKHSTGGVGDKTSLIIAPLAASCGIAVPMISGRSLGHTGGTLDKLESIKGFNVNLSTAEFKRIVKECGYAMAGQTADIAPADKKIYALRDATATVSTVPLIVASIMSKKLAEGLDALVLDVKTGNGAFMSEFENAKRLAEAMVETGNSFGVKTQALITDMNQPLGKYVGNAHEVFECVKVLRNEIDDQMKPMLEVALELASRMLLLSHVSESTAQAKELLVEKIESGEALEKFRKNLVMQGGTPEICDEPGSLLDRNLFKLRIESKRDGFVSKIETTKIGKAISYIGGGRLKAGDSIDHSVGYACEAKLGDEIRRGEALGMLFCRDKNQADSISEKLRSAYRIADIKPRKKDLIKDVI
ncbi:MAG: thymidine phosphorylase [Pyrinomonadaceae bacterium]|nr:thymidine phosphorylase [Pyrinomonadaceae bacterium]